jgi:hypothetical protein
MPVLPPPPARRLTTAEAIAIAKRARKLLRKGLLTPTRPSFSIACSGPAAVRRPARSSSATPRYSDSAIAPGAPLPPLWTLCSGRDCCPVSNAGCAAHGTKAAPRRVRRRAVTCSIRRGTQSPIVGRYLSRAIAKYSTCNGRPAIYQSVCIPPRLPGVNRSKRLIQWREPA